MPHTASTEALHMQRVRRFFESSPPLHPDTAAIVLRSYLNVPESLIPLAMEVAAERHQPSKAA